MLIFQISNLRSQISPSYSAATNLLKFQQELFSLARLLIKSSALLRQITLTTNPCVLQRIRPSSKLSRNTLGSANQVWKFGSQLFKTWRLLNELVHRSCLAGRASGNVNEI